MHTHFRQSIQAERPAQSEPPLTGLTRLPCKSGRLPLRCIDTTRPCRTVISLVLLVSVLCIPAPGLADTSDDQDEAPHTFEIIGATKQRSLRDIPFPTPALPSPSRHPSTEQPTILSMPSMTRAQHHHPPLHDDTQARRTTRTPARPIDPKPPHYPRFAREQGWSGVSLLRLSIAPDGSLLSAEVTQSSNHPLLDDAALETVKQWRFAPAKNGEFPIASVANLPIRFVLDSAK